MKKTPIIITAILLLTLSFSSKKEDSIDEKAQSGYVPKEGLIPNEETAIKIAETILIPIYGERVLKARPFTVELKNEVWYVKGSLPEGYLGGVPYVEIQKNDCKILRVIHSK